MWDGLDEPFVAPWSSMPGAGAVWGGGPRPGVETGSSAAILFQLDYDRERLYEETRWRDARSKRLGDHAPLRLTEMLRKIGES